jgi:hypothetical protein
MIKQPFIGKVKSLASKQVGSMKNKKMYENGIFDTG